MIGDQPAFPSMDMNSHIGVDRLELRYTGLTKREYYAGLAMQTIIHRWAPLNQNGLSFYIDVAEESVNMADALLKALETKTE